MTATNNPYINAVNHFKEKIERKDYTPYNDEAALQGKCMSWFKKEYPGWHCLMYEVKNDGWKGHGTANRDKKMGTKAGVSDCVFQKPGMDYHSLSLEFKVEEIFEYVPSLKRPGKFIKNIIREKGRLRAEQIHFRDTLNKAGGKYLVVRQLEDFQLFMIQYTNEIPETWQNLPEEDLLF